MKILRALALCSFGAAGVVVACSTDGSSPAVSAGPDAGAPDGVASDASASAARPPPPLDDGSTPPPAACGSAACTSATYKNVIPLHACCASAMCGLDLTPLTAIRTAPAGCTQLAAPGRNDQCSGLVVGPENDGGDPTVYQGCCRPDDTCAVRIHLGGGLDFGCQAAESFLADAAADGGTCSFDAATD